MTFICNKCYKSFSNKHRLNTHLESNVCVRRSEKRMCKLCNQIFANNNGYKYHIEHKVCQKYISNDELSDTVKVMDTNETKLSLELEKMKIELQIEEEKTKQRMIESEEKNKEKQIAEEKTKQKQIELEIIKQKMIIKMKPQTVNNTTNNNTTNNTNSNNTYNIDIHPVAFGEEDLSELDDERVIRYILNRPAKAIEDIVNIVYCSKKNRLNHTVYIPARNKSVAMVSNGSRFVHRDATETINQIYGNSKDKLDDILEANSEILTNHLTKCYSNIEYDPKHEERVKKNIKFEMINMEPVIKNESIEHQKSKNKTDHIQ